MTENKKVFVLGMAKSGYEAAKLLAGMGYRVVVNDLKTEQNPQQMNELLSMGVEVVLGSHPDSLFDNTFEMLVKNPGIPNTHMYAAKARDFNIPVINEMELGVRYFPRGATIVGVTGTNGKTTTTTIIYEFLKKASKSAFLMGNIGYPVCSFVGKIKDGDIAVMEVSDHQLSNVLDFKTNISVLTNLSEAHLDFHGSYDIYKSMKKRIFNHHTSSDTAILNLDDEEVLELASDIASTRKYFSLRQENKIGCSIIDGFICYNNDRIIALGDIKIRGRHNYENAMAAIAVVKEFGVDNQCIVDVLKNFGGVEHRIEYVKTVNGIEFYNDSKSTNITATQIALSSIDKPTVLLLGGLDRGHSFSELRSFMKNVKLIASYGETKSRIYDFAAECGIPCIINDNLEEAVKSAYDSSRAGYAVLLSPACASWDQYANYEIRGNMFKEYVSRL